jgi:transketolase
LHTVTAVADRLRREGIAMRVISMHTLKPIDNEALCVAARETSAILTVEEHRVDGGLGSRVADALVAANLNVPMQKIGVGADIILETGSTEFLRESMGSIELAAKELLVGKAQSR